MIEGVQLVVCWFLGMCEGEVSAEKKGENAAYVDCWDVCNEEEEK